MSLLKLMIRGIRSYSSKRPSIVEFFTPLTLIVGKNGTGKTTIIESLRYVLTGDLPANSKGGAFIYDPKIAREVDTKAQVRLKFTNIKNEEFIITRSLQLTQKTSTQQQKTIENLLSTKNGDKFDSISGKIGDIDKHVETILNLSKPLIENIILCNQEDSTWCLAEPSAIKKRLDDIFNSTKYIKALEKLKELKKTKQQDLKLIKQEIEFLKKNKERKDFLLSEKNRLDNKQNIYNGFVEELTIKIKEKEEENNYLKVKIKEIEKLEQNKNQNKIRIERLKEEIKKIKFYEVKIEELSVFHEKKISNKTALLNKDCIALLEEEATKESKNVYALNENIINIQKKIEKHNYIHKILGDRRKKKEKITEAIKKENNIKIELIKLLEVMLDKELEIRKYNKKLASELLKEENIKNDKIIELLKRSSLSLKNNCEGNNSLLDNSIINVNISNTSLNKLIVNLVAYFLDKSVIKNYFEELLDIYNKKNKEYKEKEQKQREIDNLINRAVAEIKMLCKDDIDIENIENNIFQYNDKIENKIIEIKNKINYTYKESKDEEKNSYNSFLDKITEIKDKIRDRMVFINQKVNKYYKDYEQNIKVKNLNDRKEFLVKEIDGNSVEELESRKKYLLAKGTSISDEDLQNKIRKIIDIEKEIRNYFKNKENSFLNETMADEKDINLYEIEEESIIDINIQKEELILCRKNVICSDNASNIYSGIKKIVEERGECPICNTKINYNEFDDNKNGYRVINKIDGIINKINDKKIVQLNNIDNLSKNVEEIERINILIGSKNELLSIFKKNNYYKSRNSKIDTEEELKDIYNKINYIKELSIIEKELRKYKVINYKNYIENTEGFKNILIEEDKNYSIESLKSIISFLTTIQNSIKELEQMVLIKNKLIDFKGLKNRNVYKQLDKKELDEVLNKINEYRLIFTHKIENLHEEKDNLKKKYNEYKEIEEILNNNKLDEECKDENSNDNNTININNESYNLNTIDLDSLELTLNNLKKDFYNTKDIVNEKIERKRNIEENIKYRKYKEELDEIYKKYKDIKTAINNRIEEILKTHNIQEDNGGENKRIKSNENPYNLLLNESKRLEEEYNKLQEKKNISLGELKQLTFSIARYKNEIDEFKNIDEEYFKVFLKNKIIENSMKDIDKMVSSIDSGLMKYHNEKILEVNNRLKALWMECYKGNDIDYVELQSTLKNNNYNYKMVMFKNGVELDLRGRCSAGQKVLLSILFRLSLLESFVIDNNLLALDEPTTNLDKDGIEALASLINQMVLKKNMQLIIITHDEEFVNLINAQDYFYRLDRDENGNSIIEKIKT